MKSNLFVILFVFWTCTSAGQTITGKIVDISTGEPLAYVNIGVIGQPRGTITNETGNFELETNELPVESTVRFSMIGYIAQTYTVKQLSDSNGKTFELESASIPLSEFVVNPGKLRKIGETKNAPWQFCCGWGGDNLGKGHEIGTKMELGELPVHLKSLHIRIYKQSFDNCLLRLHVRNIVNELPFEELLTQNVYIPITKESGWVEIDLSSHHLVFQGDVVMSLEWISVKGDNKKKYVSVKSDGKKMSPKPVILFSSAKNQGYLYSRWGSEARWTRSERTACFYLTVR